MLSAVSINTSTISKNSVQAVDQTLPYKIFPTVLLSVYQSLLNNFHSLEVISYANFSARTMFILITHLCFNVHHYFFCILKNHIGKYNVSIYSQFLLLTIFLYTQCSCAKFLTQILIFFDTNFSAFSGSILRKLICIFCVKINKNLYIKQHIFYNYFRYRNRQ